VPAILLRFLPHLIALGLVVAAVAYVHQRAFNAGEAKIQARWDADKAIQKLAYDKAAAETARIEEQRDQLSYRIDHVLKPKLAATESANRDLASRVLNYSSRPRSAVPEISNGTRGPSVTVRIGGDESKPDDRVREALSLHLAACDRDAIRLNGWIEWYQLMRGAVP
jgi:hypothetical protein